MIFFIILTSISYVGALENFGFFLLVHNSTNTPRYVNTATSAMWNGSVSRDDQLKSMSTNNSIDIAIPSIQSSQNINNTRNQYSLDECNFMIETLLRNNTINKERDINPLIVSYRQQQQNTTNMTTSIGTS